VLEGRVVISDCGCWTIYRYFDSVVLRFHGCSSHIGAALDRMEKLLYLDKVGSVSDPEVEVEQLWLT